MIKPSLHSLLLPVFALLCLGAMAPAQNYTSIVVIGDSLSDTGNDAALSAAKYTVNLQLPGPATGYTDGRFTDGLDTSPAARSYTGVWVEQLAAKLAAKPPVVNSLAGGTNYAYGFAFTGAGTTDFTYGPLDAFSITINNLGQQLSDYLATSPTITSSTLFIVWGGANDLNNATSAADIITAATNEVDIVQQLIAAGATDFIVPNLPPLGLIPRNNGSPMMSAEANAASQAFDEALAAGLATLPAANPGKTLHINQLDTYTLFSTVVGPPLYPGFANVTDSAQGNTAVNPDTYLFWDSLHPTTYGHSLLASTALTLLGPPVATTTALASSSAAVNLNSSVTFTASVTSTPGMPMGTVTFLDGTTSLGSSLVLVTPTGPAATFTTSTLTGGSHTITAAFVGANNYVGSTSASLTEVVTPPDFQAALSPSSLTLTRGMSGMSSLTVTPVGGFAGSVSVACGSVPAHFSCTVGTPTLTLSGAAAGTSSITIATDVATAQLIAPHSAGSMGALAAACVFFGGLASARRRLRNLKPAALLLLLVSFGAVTVLSGCASDKYANDAPAGSYTIPITVTPATGGAKTVTLTVVVQ